MIIYAIDADTINECLSYNWDEGSIFMNGWEISGFVYFYILQQRYMIAARYLQACHFIFEKGILSNVFIRSNESAVLKIFNIYLALQMCPHWTLFIKSLTLKLWCILFLMVIMVLRNLFFPAKFLKTLFRAGKVALHAP